MYFGGDILIWRNTGFLAIFVFFVFVFFGGAGFLVPTYNLDAATVTRLAVEARFVEGKGGYYYTALLAANIPDIAQRILVFLVGVVFIIRILENLRHPAVVAIALFLAIAPIILFLTLFLKDTFVAILAITTLAIFSTKCKNTTKIMLVVGVYCAYGSLFRQYYLLIAVVFVSLYFISRIAMHGKIILIFFLAIGIFLVPEDLFSELQGSRDTFNIKRVGRDLPGSRTAFLNLLPPTDLFNFLTNYVYAFLRLNFGFLFNFGLREMFLSANLFVYAALLGVGLRTFDQKAQLACTLFFSHLLVLNLFEPDLGSYLRHASSVLVYLAPSLALFDKRIRNKLM